jgi:hypothetical protein
MLIIAFFVGTNIVVLKNINNTLNVKIFNIVSTIFIYNKYPLKILNIQIL